MDKLLFIGGLVFVLACAMIIPEMRTLIFNIAALCNDVLLAGFKTITQLQ